MIPDSDICRRIIEHLANQNDHKDKLDGILLSIYESEIQLFNNKILKNIGYLISVGAIMEVANNGDNRSYTLSDDLPDLSEIIKEE